MPFVTGLLFFPAFVASVALLGQIPRQSAEDAAARTERVPFLLLRGAPLRAALSLSHHGRFAAFALRLAPGEGAA